MPERALIPLGALPLSPERARLGTDQGAVDAPVIMLLGTTTPFDGTATVPAMRTRATVAVAVAVLMIAVVMVLVPVLFAVLVVLFALLEA